MRMRASLHRLINISVLSQIQLRNNTLTQQTTQVGREDDDCWVTDMRFIVARAVSYPVEASE